MQPFEELFDMARRLDEVAALAEADDFKEPIARVTHAAESVADAWSGSWAGYQATIYYAGLQRPPSGAFFSREWGLMRVFDQGSKGDWREYHAADVQAEIRRRHHETDLARPMEIAAKATETFTKARAAALSILHVELAERPDTYLEQLEKEVEKLTTVSANDVIEFYRPKGQFMTRDTRAVNGGVGVPPHMIPLAEVIALGQSVGVCKRAADAFSKAASHLERKTRKTVLSNRVGTNVFIGHGRSMAWRELKDFVQERLRLPFDEFNRVPVAGVTNIARLSAMLDAAAIAFLIMTGEDETADGELRARSNVIHEAGLFQGRLGFSKAIVLLEEGCAEFSNIAGLGQIRFPRGNIAAAFEEVRKVLEREGLIDP